MGRASPGPPLQADSGHPGLGDEKHYRLPSMDRLFGVAFLRASSSGGSARPEGSSGKLGSFMPFLSLALRREGGAGSLKGRSLPLLSRGSPDHSGGKAARGPTSASVGQG